MVPCPEPPEAAMDRLAELPEPWLTWYWEDWDPYCEGIYNATHPPEK